MIKYGLIVVLAVIVGVALAEAPPVTSTLLPAGQPVDADAVGAAVKKLDTAATQLGGVEARLNADVEVVAGILVKCGFTLTAVSSAAGTQGYENERAARTDEVVRYCSDPATLTKVKPSLTDEDRAALSNAKVDLIGLQAQVSPVLTDITGAISVLQNAVFGLPAMIAGGASGGNVEALSKLLGEATTALTKALTLPTRVNKTVENISRLLGFINMVL